jgi:hypothetical protein
MQWLTELKSILTNKIGRINSRALSRQYFDKIDKVKIWDTFIENTLHLESYSYSDRIKFLDAGHLTELPKCACGNDITILDHKVSKFCSVKCSLADPTRSEKISKTKQSADNKSITEKRKKTMMEKYGVEFNSQRQDIKHLWTKPKLTESIVSLLEDKEWLHHHYNVLGKSGSELGEELGIHYGTVLSYCKTHGFVIQKNYNVSKEEKKLLAWLKSLDICVEHGRQDLLVGKLEIDCFVPSKNVGIEMNGIYWHSDKFNDQNKHIYKTNIADSKNISLIQITDYDWRTKEDIVKSIIKNKLGLNDRVLYARKCFVKDVSVPEEKEFLFKNHIQGHIGSKIKLGLYYEDELVQLLTFGKPRFDEHHEWEILRSCSLNGVTVVGGFDKLIDHFIKNYCPKSIISYVDRQYFSGSGYKNWSLLKTTSPGYFWTNGTDIISRFKSQKAQLKKWLPTYDSSKSETDNMKNAGYYRYWNCGNHVFSLTL